MSVNGDLKNLFLETEKLYWRNMKTVHTGLLEEYTKAHNLIKVKLQVLYSKMEGRPTLFQASQYQRLTNLERQISEILMSLNKTIKGKTANLIKNDFADGYYAIGYSTETALQISLRFGLLDTEVIKSAIANPLDRVKWQKRADISTQQLITRVNGEITSGLIQGRGVVGTTKEIRRTMNKDFNNNVMRIVRTETQRARSWGTLSGSQQAQHYAELAGINMYRQWLSTLDIRTRADHVEMDGKKETKNGTFEFPDGTITEGPLLSGVASQDINCRCTTIEVVDDVPPKTRYDNELKKKIPYTTFKDYKAKWALKRKSALKKPAELVK